MSTQTCDEEEVSEDEAREKEGMYASEDRRSGRVSLTLFQLSPADEDERQNEPQDAHEFRVVPDRKVDDGAGAVPAETEDGLRVRVERVREQVGLNLNVKFQQLFSWL